MRLGERRGGISLLLQLAAAAFVVVALLSITVVEGDAVDSEIEEKRKEVCEWAWDDEEGRKACMEADYDYLPDDEDMEEEEEEDVDEEAEAEAEADRRYYYNIQKYKSRPSEEEDWEVWKHGGKMEIYEQLECPGMNDDGMYKGTSFEKFHNNETWKTFNKIYNQVISAAQQDDDLKQDPTIPSEFGTHGFQFPIEIKIREAVGRGVYAKTDIPKGSLLYISTNNAAFHNGQTYRNFIKALPTKLACDVMIWAFVRWVSLETEHDDKHMVCVDLDEGSFVNSADSTDSFNMALGNDSGALYGDLSPDDQSDLWHGCKMKFYAAREIKAGEEILAAYGDFAETDGWLFLGL